MLANHQAIERTVTELPDGVETLTESADPKIAAKIQEHVHWMETRIKDASPIRMRDPLFREIFRHTEKIHMEHQLTERGVKVRETSTDPYVAKLIQAHAEVVSGFVKRGFAEAMKNHAVPDQVASPTPTALQENPAIAPYGPIAHLPDAVQQPRPGSKLLVDLTGGGDPDKLLKSIEKVARYVNIYKGAGSEAQQVDITVVIHGDATLAVLNDDAYAKKFGLEGNPNLDCLHKLHDAGVELLVCGQSLISKGGQPQEVVVFIDTAVSALTALVNLQSDGYAYVPLAGK